MSTKTNFAGLELRNPIIIGSCGLTAQAASNKAFEQAGAGAVVLKSLFEENIARQTEMMTDEYAHSEASDYLQGYMGEHILSEYLSLIRESKRLCTIPIIASLSCYTDSERMRFAAEIEKAGADALELNMMTIRTSKDYCDGELEQSHIEILRHVRQTVRIPVIVKLGANISNPVALADRLRANGADAVVLFNRLYPTDIDIDKMEYTMSHPFTTAAELSNSLRWAGLVSAAVPQLPVAVSGGVHAWQDVVKSILAGALGRRGQQRDLRLRQGVDSTRRRRPRKVAAGALVRRPGSLLRPHERPAGVQRRASAAHAVPQIHGSYQIRSTLRSEYRLSASATRLAGRLPASGNSNRTS